MLENINNLLENNEILVRIGNTWYLLDEVGPIEPNSFPVWVSDEDGKEFEFDIADIDEFDPIISIMDSNIIGIS